jgi:hypothetical protein
MLGAGELDPVPAAGGAAATLRAEQTRTGVRVSSQTDATFLRRDDHADVSPDAVAQNPMDRVSARLAALREDVSRPVASSNVGGPSALWSTPSGTAGGTGGGGQSISLTRGGTGGGGAPLALGRGGGTAISGTLAKAGTVAPRAEAPAGEAAGDAHARRTLAGAQLAGPIADRAIVHSATPAYPDWAKRTRRAAAGCTSSRADGTAKEKSWCRRLPDSGTSTTARAPHWRPGSSNRSAAAAPANNGAPSPSTSVCVNPERRPAMNSRRSLPLAWAMAAAFTVSASLPAAAAPPAPAARKAGTPSKSAHAPAPSARRSRNGDRTAAPAATAKTGPGDTTLKGGDEAPSSARSYRARTASTSR